MEIKINLKKLKEYKLLPNQYILLFLLYNKEFDYIKDIYGIREAVDIRNSLIDTEFILSDNNTKFTETILSNKHVMKLFNIRSDVINFWNFYICYPIKVGSRVLRAAGPTSQVALKHEKKYLKRVTSLEQHEKAIKAIECYVSKKRSEGKLQYLENMETIMNNSLWEQWEIFINEQEEFNWNTENI